MCAMDSFVQHYTYKPSGVDWLGDVPAHWEVMKVSRLFSIGSGTTPPTERSEYYGGGIPWITTSELRENVVTSTEKTVTEEALRAFPTLNVFPKGSIAVAMYGATIGRLGILGVPATVNQACCVFSEANGMSARFWFYWLQSRRQYLISIGHGGGQPNLSQKMLRSIQAPVPPLPEQTAIARYLDHIDRRIQRYIQATQKRITLLHEARQATIQRAVTRGLNPDVPLKPSGVDWLGDVPAHWEVRRLRYLIEGNLTYGANAAAEHDNPNWPRYLRITDFALDGTLRDDTFRSLPPEVARDYLVKPGDLLLARSGATVGKAFLVTSEVGQACHAGYLIRARPRSCLVEPRFLFAFTQSAMFTRWKDSTFIIATIPNISAEKYANLSVPTPPLEEQKQIAAHLNKATAAIDTAIDAARRQTEHMQEYRASLIAHVVTGKLDVRAAAERISMATS